MLVKFDCAVITYRHLLSAIMALMSFHKRPLPNDNAYLLLFIMSTEDEITEGQSSAPQIQQTEQNVDTEAGTDLNHQVQMLMQQKAFYE